MAKQSEAALKAKAAKAAKAAAKAAKVAKAAKAAAKKAESKAGPKGPPKCDCPSTIARKEFKKAKTCAAKTEALDRLKALVSKDLDLLKPGQKALLYRDALLKEKQKQAVCAAEEAAQIKKDRERLLSSQAMDGLGRYGSRRRQRH